MQLQSLLINWRERKLREMYSLTWGQIWRLISRERMKREICRNSCLKQRKFYPGKGKSKGWEKAACLAVGKRKGQRPAYKMAEFGNRLMAVLAVGDEEHENVRSFSVAFILLRKRKLWYVSSGSIKVAVCRNKRLFLLPTAGNGRLLFLNHGDSLLLMSQGLYSQVPRKEIEGCLNQKGSCEEKALRLVNLSCKDRKRERIGSAVVVIQLE